MNEHTNSPYIPFHDFTPRDLLERIARRASGSHVVVYFEMPDLPQLKSFFASLPTVVVDHLSRPDVRKGPDRPENQRYPQPPALQQAPLVDNPMKLYWS